MSGGRTAYFRRARSCASGWPGQRYCPCLHNGSGRTRNPVKNTQRGKHFYSLAKSEALDPEAIFQKLLSIIQNRPRTCHGQEGLTAYLKDYQWKQTGLEEAAFFKAVSFKVREQTGSTLRVRRWKAAVNAMGLLSHVDDTVTTTV